MHLRRQVNIVSVSDNMNILYVSISCFNRLGPGLQLVCRGTLMNRQPLPDVLRYFAKMGDYINVNVYITVLNNKDLAYGLPIYFFVLWCYCTYHTCW
jgi:hypothetical protein